MSQTEFNTVDAELVDFKVEEEHWQYYDLSDGSKLKIKLVLTQVLRSRNQMNKLGEPIYSWNAPTFLSIVSCLNSLRSRPTDTPVTPDRIADNIDVEVDFKKASKNDEWNVYTLTDGTTLQLKPKVNSIARTKLKGQAGEPVYTVATGNPTYKVKISNDLIRKPKRE
ncbi:MAG TPA: hypothetical protein VJZ32_07705 [Candidatus Bathyarchaeia archaeon]|nr:hypothetical protein [Candidatus Bathyarchaeia archaeon]HKM77459.1 hypothetical protein [Candidatus Bathyarchaeia archaeon]